jgi:hypothetical protein
MTRSIVNIHAVRTHVRANSRHESTDFDSRRPLQVLLGFSRIAIAFCGPSAKVSALELSDALAITN